MRGNKSSRVSIEDPSPLHTYTLSRRDFAPVSRITKINAAPYTHEGTRARFVGGGPLSPSPSEDSNNSEEESTAASASVCLSCAPSIAPRKSSVYWFSCQTPASARFNWLICCSLDWLIVAGLTLRLCQHSHGHKHTWTDPR